MLLVRYDLSCYIKDILIPNLHFLYLNIFENCIALLILPLSHVDILRNLTGMSSRSREVVTSRDFP